MTTGEIIRAYRREHYMSGQDLATLLGVSSKLVYYIEADQRKVTPRLMERLPDELRARVAESLIGEHEKAIQILRESAA